MTESDTSFLRRQIVEMERLAESAGDDPLTAFAIEARKNSLLEELAGSLPESSETFQHQGDDHEERTDKAAL